MILSEKQYRQKLLKLEKEQKEKQLHSQDETERLESKIKSLEKQIAQLNNEHLATMEKIDQHKHSHDEHEQQLQEEIQRLRRDLGLELYRKQDAEKKARSLEDKLRAEQTQLHKTQFDFTKVKHDLKTLQVKYDALQLEMIEMHKNISIKPRSIIRTLDGKTSTSTITREPSSSTEISSRPVRTKRRTNDDCPSEQEAKKPKRATRSRSRASSPNISLNGQSSDEQIIGKTSKSVTRNGSSVSTSNQIPIPIRQIKKKSTNVSSFSQTI